VIDEYGIARQQQRPAIAMIERDVAFGGAYGNDEHVPFDRGERCEAMIRLSETIGLWKNEAGRSLEIRLLPEAAATLASNDNAKCEYRLVSPPAPPTPWREAAARPTPGGVFLTVPGVKLEQAIQVKISEGNVARWQSTQQPQWFHVELKTVP
jgi:hypothetical protein